MTDSIVKMHPEICLKCGLNLQTVDFIPDATNRICGWCRKIETEFPGNQTDAEIHRKLTSDIHETFFRLRKAILWWPETKISSTAFLKLVDAEEAMHRAADEFFEKKVESNETILETN